MNKDLKKKIEKDGFELVDLVNLGERECTRLYGKVALRQINEALDEEGLPRVGEVTINFWPSSQLCMDCDHGTFEPLLESATYRCWEKVVLGSCAARCDKQEPKEEEE